VGGGGALRGRALENPLQWKGWWGSGPAVIVKIQAGLDSPPPKRPGLSLTKKQKGTGARALVRKAGERFVMQFRQAGTGEVAGYS